jgi:hypothetical protein
MPDINYVNPQINNIDKQEISIQISLNGFSYLIRAKETHQCLLFKHFEFKNTILIDELIRKVESLVAKESIFSNSFTKASLVFISQKATLVPEDFFNPEHLKKYFEFSHSMDELDELHYYYIDTLQTYNVFSFPNYLTSIFYSLLPNIKFNHQSSTLINFGLSKFGQKKCGAIIGINKLFFDIEVFENGKLILSNSFQYANTMDFIYFVLYTCKQLKIDLYDIELITLGETINNKAIISELQKHFPNLIIPKLEVPLLCKNLGNADAIRFYNLFLSD